MNNTTFLNQHNFDDSEALISSLNEARKVTLREMLATYDLLQKLRQEIVTIADIEPKARDALVIAFGKALSQASALEKQIERLHDQKGETSLDLERARGEITDRLARIKACEGD